MRIICPFTEVDPDTKEALKDYDVEFVFMSTPFSYKELMEKIWQKPEDIILVEHDTVPWDRAIDVLVNCKEHDWCGYGYSAESPEVAFGLCKLTAKHMKQIPDLWKRMKLRNWRDVCAHHGSEYQKIDIKPFQHKPHVINTGLVRQNIDSLKLQVQT